MAKKIRFPLELADGTQARSLEELKEHFDLDSMLGYYKDGKLLTWLRDRYIEAEADAVEALEENAPDFQQGFCAVFGVECSGDGVDLEAIQRRQERLVKLRAVTDDIDAIAHIDQVAFDQEELADLLDEGTETIYLCGEKFTVPASIKNVKYVGIEQPGVHISGKVDDAVDELAQRFAGCDVDNLPAADTQLPIDFPEIEAIVKGVHLDSGNKGFRTVQVDFEHSVYLDGVEYDHVPILSYDLFEKMDLRKGSKVKVHRVGDVIPAISMIDRGDGRKLEVKRECSCGTFLAIKNKKLFCCNPNCPDNQVGRLIGFLAGIGMEGYSDAFVQQIHSVLKVNSIADLLEKVNKESLMEADIATKTNLAFHDALVKTLETTPDYTVLGAMGIPDIGPVRALQLITKFEGIALLVKGAVKFTNAMAAEVFAKGFASPIFIQAKIRAVVPEKTALPISRLIMGPDFQADLRAVLKHMKNFTTDFSGAIKRIGHTGLTPSQAVRDACNKQRFQIVDGKAFDMLIVPNHEHCSAKVDKAEKDDTIMYTEEEFLGIYNPR